MKRNSPASPLERAAAVYIALMFSVFLLYPGLGGYAQITRQKWLALLCLTGGYLLASAILLLKKILSGRRRFGRRWQPQRALIAGFLLWSILSCCCSPYGTAAFWGGSRREGLITILLYGGGCLLVSLYGRPQKWMLFLFGGAVSINCGIALLQLTGYNPLGLYPAGMNYHDADIRYAGAFLGTVGNIDILSALFCVTIPAFWVSIVVLKDKKRFWLFLPLLLSLAVLLKMNVTGGILAVFGGAVLIFPVLLREKARRRWAAVGVLCLLVCTLILLYFLGPRLGGVCYEASQVLHGHWEDAYGSGRGYIWRSVWPLAKERLWLGGGPDTLGLRTSAAFERYDPALGVLIRSKVDTAHNEYLNLLINQGLPALVFYLAVLAVSAVQWIRYAWKSPVVAICGSGILCYCIQAFFGISSPAAAPYLWLALGLFISGASALREG